MLSFIVILSLSLTAVHCWDYTEPAKFEITAVKSERDLFSKYPDAVELERVGPNSPEAYNIQYQVGYRRPGDKLVSSAGNSSSWPTPHDVTLTLNYPRSGLGAQVTYVVIAVTQTSTAGKAYITSGGVGQRHISIAVVASYTTIFNYSAYFYGL